MCRAQTGWDCGGRVADCEVPAKMGRTELLKGAFETGIAGGDSGSRDAVGLGYAG